MYLESDFRTQSLRGILRRLIKKRLKRRRLNERLESEAAPKYRERTLQERSSRGEKRKMANFEKKGLSRNENQPDKIGSRKWSSLTNRPYLLFV